MSSLRLCEHHKLTRLVCVVAARRFVLSISAVHSRAQFYFVINFNVNDARCEMNVIIISHRCVCSCVVAYVFRDCLRQADVFFFFIAINLTQNTRAPHKAYNMFVTNDAKHHKERCSTKST